MCKMILEYAAQVFIGEYITCKILTKQLLGPMWGICHFCNKCTSSWALIG